MNKKMFLLALLLAVCYTLTSCNDWVTDTDSLIDNVEDDVLDDAALMDFLIIGVNGHLSLAVDLMFAEADLLSDQMYFEPEVGGTFTHFIEIDNGTPEQDRQGAFDDIHDLRFFAEDLIRRANDLGIERDDVSFTGNFNSAIANYLLATYWALTPTNPGSPIDAGPMVPSSELYETAIAKFTIAKTFAPNDLAIRQINSFIAKCYLYNNNNAQAKSFAQQGMVNGDAPFNVLYNEHTQTGNDNRNYYYVQFGIGRYQGAPDPRFKAYVDNDPNESNRTPLAEINEIPVQDKYRFMTSPVSMISWQENELMLAELSILDGNNDDALTRINSVRASHSIDPLATADINVLISERDKELFLTGTRLVDQRRFNIWHLGSDTWKYFPIPDDERNANPNID